MQAERWVEALARTRRTAFGRLASLLGATELKPGFWQALEASLIQADLGVRISDEILVALKDLAASQGLTRGEQLQDRLRELLVQRLQSQPCTEIDANPRI
ncbi:MAG: signal recognition particle receptor subunit alpha, partial [Anaerolineales bacterium]